MYPYVFMHQMYQGVLSVSICIDASNVSRRVLDVLRGIKCIMCIKGYYRCIRWIKCIPITRTFLTFYILYMWVGLYVFVTLANNKCVYAMNLTIITCFAFFLHMPLSFIQIIYFNASSNYCQNHENEMGIPTS